MNRALLKRIPGGTTMNQYQKEQLDALVQVRGQLAALNTSRHQKLVTEIDAYVKFRHRLESFLEKQMGGYCSQACYESRTSACCSKDGVIIFWADVVVNALSSSRGEMESLEKSIKAPAFPDKCIHLTANGCRWRVRPLVCAMFVCQKIEREVIDQDETVTTDDDPPNQC